MQEFINKPTPAFIGASWVALCAGSAAYMIGLFNADMLLNSKGYYLVVLLYGLFSSISLQKAIRDRLEDIAVTHLYYGLCWASVIICIALLGIGLWNAPILLSEKGFYLMAFFMALFGAVCVQKNVRDLEYLRTHHPDLLNIKKPPRLKSPDEKQD